MSDYEHNSSSHWSAAEDELLRKGYGVIDMALLVKMFGRSFGAIRFQAYKLGIKVALPIRKRVGAKDYKGDDAIARAYIRGCRDGEQSAQAQINMLEAEAQRLREGVAVNRVNCACGKPNCNKYVRIEAAYGGSPAMLWYLTPDGREDMMYLPEGNWQLVRTTPTDSSVGGEGGSDAT